MDEVVIDAEIGRKKVGVVAIDRERRFLGCNEAARRYFPMLNDLAIDKEGMGTQFDASLNPYYMKCREKLEAYYSSLENWGADVPQ